MNDNTDDKGRSFFNRFKFQVDRLFNGTDAEKATAQQRIPTLISEANAAGYGLPKPEQLGINNFDGDALAEFTGGANYYEVATQSTDKTGAAKKPTKAEKREAAQQKRAEAKAVKAEAKAGAKAAPRQKKSTRPDGLNEGPCMDGCGDVVKGRFRPGHDAKLKSLILKIERGEDEPTSVPEVAQPYVKFKKGELMVEKNAQGVVTEQTQTWICTEAPVKLPSHGEATAA